MKLTLIIPTKSRKKDLKDCLDSITIQNRIPEEIIIIDDGGNYNINKVLDIFKNQLNFKLIRNEVSQGHANARNQGIDISNGDIIFFLDDDCVVLDNYFFEIEKIYLKDKNKKIGGVEGLIVNEHFENTNLRNLFNKIFMLYGIANTGIMQSSGCSLAGTENKVIVKTQTLCGASSYRREVYNEFSYESKFNGWSPDDHVFAYQVSRKWTLIRNPKAKMLHNHSFSARENIIELRSKRIWHHYVIWRKIMPLTPYYILCYLWSSFGLFLENIYLYKVMGLKASIKGYSKIVSFLTFDKNYI